MSNIPQTSPADLRDALARGEVVLIDVREPQEYAAERIPGALLYPLSTFDASAIAPVVAGRKVVMQCAGGVRSMRAAQALAGVGASRIENLDGGINAWKAQGLPLVRVDPATGQVVEQGAIKG
jgi:rhodanese-related sulfurtransferase